MHFFFFYKIEKKKILSTIPVDKIIFFSILYDSDSKNCISFAEKNLHGFLANLPIILI